MKQNISYGTFRTPVFKQTLQTGKTPKWYMMQTLCIYP